MDKANHGRMKVAFQRLKMFTEEMWPESIIDAMVGFEALYCDKNDVDKGLLIARRTTKLIGSQDGIAFIESFLVEAHRLGNRIVRGEDVIPGHWVELIRMVLRNDSDLKPFLSEPNSDNDRKLPPTAIEALGRYVCRSIQEYARLDARTFIVYTVKDGQACSASPNVISGKSSCRRRRASSTWLAFEVRK